MTISAFAKVNLSLEVFGKRPDGYHALRSVVAPISLADELTLVEADEFSTDTGYPDDLILKAVTAFKGHFGTLPRAYKILVKKHIPAGGGLGGGSADAAATLIALNSLYSTNYSPMELAQIGAEVGSDVPALVLGNINRAPVLMEGRGERVTALPAAPSRTLVLANPGVNVSTKLVYQNCIARTKPANGNVNDLESPAIKLFPEIAQLKKLLSTLGLSEVMMSGSGSTVFGFAENEAAGGNAITALKKANILSWCAHTL